jgi:hypothetical protein
MELRPRRFIFSGLEALLKGKIGKLAALCEKLFIFIDEEEPLIPVAIVQKLQKYGKKIKWVSVEMDLPSDLQVFFSFFVGKIHEKASPDVEFILLDEGRHYDSLVRHLNAYGRSCLCLDPSRALELLGPGYGASLLEPTVLPMAGEREKEPYRIAEPSEAGEPAGKGDLHSGKIAQEVVQRMLRSGNRPAELANLREYIQACCQTRLGKSQIDSVIKSMQDRKDISLDGESEVAYNF